MYSRVLSASLYGLSGEETWVEVDVESGLPVFNIVGLANQSIKEAKERIHAAVMNCGFDFESHRITVNLTPANKKKDGSHFDLPIAIALLMSTGQLKPHKGEKKGPVTAYLGELTLDGRLSAVEGVLPMIIGMQKRGVKRVVIPAGNLPEAELVRGMEIIAASTLTQVTEHISGMDIIDPIVADGRVSMPENVEISDFSDIRGQELVKRAAQVAAAGMHGMLMIGPPGVGKSMIGKRIPGIMPPMTYEEQLDVTQIYSAAGALSEKRPMISERPFRAPHHSMSPAALTGGGSKPVPGEISLAHRGVLFLDELPEFESRTLDMLRQPMEDGEVSIVRVNGKCSYPARFMLIGAMNPCRCGNYGDAKRQCTCSESSRKRYISKVSGPLLDRFDIHVSMERIDFEDISALEGGGRTSAQIREEVIKAAEIQRKRYEGLGISCNSQLTPSLIKEFCRLDDGGRQLIRDAFIKWKLSARSYHRILKVARTIADLDGSENIERVHLLEALSYRQPDNYFKG